MAHPNPDFFAVLGGVRRPWLDVDELKERFLRLSAACHPDRFHGAAPEERAAAERRSTELNSAYQALREVRTRLLHLLELESGAKPRDVQRIPPGTMELFVEVGQTCREADAFLAERGRVTSPMLRVRLFEQGLDWTGRLQGLLGRIREQGVALEAELRGMDEAWAAAPAPGDPVRSAALPLGRLEELYRVLSYVARWTEQVQERLVQLAAV